MDSPIATILDVRGRAATVRVEPVGCPRCASGNGCGAGLMAPSKTATELSARIAEGLSVVAGDRVTLSVAERGLVRAALCLYGAPLSGMLIATLLAVLVAGPQNDVAALLFSLAGLVAGGAVGARFARRRVCIRHLTPTIMARLMPESTSESP